jgi:hypothetical protein
MQELTTPQSGTGGNHNRSKIMDIFQFQAGRGLTGPAWGTDFGHDVKGCQGSWLDFTSTYCKDL